MATQNRSNRYFVLSATDTGVFLEVGPAGTPSATAVMVLQFDPTVDFSGTFAIMGKCLGQWAKDQNAPFLPIPYRRVNVASVASDYAIVTDQIAAAGLIHVPLSGLSLSLLPAISAGSCKVYVWDLQGSPAV